MARRRAAHNTAASSVPGASTAKAMIDQQKAENEMAVEEQKLFNDMQHLAIEAEKNKIARQNAATQRTKAASQ